MASISNDPNGLKRIQWVGSDGKRKTIRLGKVSKRTAETFLTHIEALLEARFSNTSVPKETAIWVGGLDIKYRAKLAKHELIDAPNDLPTRKGIRYRDFVREYLDKRRPGRKPSTISNWQQAYDGFASSMPADILLSQINAGHAIDWLEKMRARQLEGEFAATTTHKRISNCKALFKYMVKSELVQSNPFEDIKLVRPKPKNNVEVSQDTIRQLLPYANEVIKATLVLTRWGGLRCPTEVLSLKWTDIDFKKSTMTISQPKIEHHEGRESRICPLFPEVREFLEKAPRKGVYVVPYAGDIEEIAKRGWKGTNLRSGLEDLLKARKVPRWPRMYVSLRASRQTEIEDEFGLPAACAWIGNTEKVAKESYLLVTEDKWKKATGK